MNISEVSKNDCVIKVNTKEELIILWNYLLNFGFIHDEKIEYINFQKVYENNDYFQLFENDHMWLGFNPSSNVKKYTIIELSDLDIPVNISIEEVKNCYLYEPVCEMAEKIINYIPEVPEVESTIAHIIAHKKDEDIIKALDESWNNQKK